MEELLTKIATLISEYEDTNSNFTLGCQVLVLPNVPDGKNESYAYDGEKFTKEK